MLQWRFSIRFDLRSTSFGSRGHQMKNYRFHGDGFSLITFVDVRDMKIKMRPPCLECRAGSKYVLFDLGRPMSKFDLRSGQVKVRSRPGHNRRSVCIYSEATWWAKSFGTIFASLSPSCREFLAKTGFWPHLTSGDLPVTPNHQLHLDHHRWGEWS